MALITRGRMDKAILGFAMESTAAGYGVLVDPATEWYRIMSEDLDFEKVTEFGPGLSTLRRTPWISSQKAGGSVTMPLDYEGIELLLYQLLGAGKTVVDHTTYGTWTFTYAEALPIGLSAHMSCDLDKWEFAGMKINTAEFKFEPGKVAMATFGFIGYSAALNGSADTPTYANINDKHPLLCTYLSAASHGVYYGDSDSEADATSYVKSVNIKVDNKLGPTEPSSCGMNTLVEPVRTGPVEISSDIVMAFQNTNAVADFLADTNVGLIVKTEGGVISGSDKYSLDIDIPFGRITPTCKPKTGGSGLYEVSFTIQHYLETAASPDEIITATLNNANTTSIDDA